MEEDRKRDVQTERLSGSIEWRKTREYRQTD